MDSSGNVWVSLSDVGAIACYAGLSSPPLYLDSQGKLQKSFSAFGAKVYSMKFDSQGCLWLGSKPDGLFRLTPKADGNFRIYNFKSQEDNLSSSGPAGNDIYDIEFDREGRLWLATMSRGIDCAPRPNDENLEFHHLIQHKEYPHTGRRVRNLYIMDDSVLCAATTGGLLTFRLPDTINTLSDIDFVMHATRPGRESSLGNVATMQVLPDAEGRIFIATESDGVNMLRPQCSPLQEDAEFIHFNSSAGTPGDVAYALAIDHGNGSVWVIAGNIIYNINQLTGEIQSIPSSFWNVNMHFSDARPLNITDNKWLIGLEKGAIVIDFDMIPRNKAAAPPVVFTSVSLQNRPDSLISARTDTIILQPNERNITINFASLNYASAENIRYSFSLDNSGWNNLGATRSVAFLDLSPGNYTLSVCSSDISGACPDSERSITLIVTPTFWETPTAYCLYTLAAIALIAAIAATAIYRRRIKRKQRELLDAYMKLIERPAVETDNTATEENTQAPASMDEADKIFMQKVLDFVNENIGNPDVSVDGLAAHTATSRSSLNRKMKSLLGVTPADFIKESRLNRAATMLAETNMSITDIAVECGFSDINYFGKCFKASRKLTPSAYRKQQAKKRCHILKDD